MRNRFFVKSISALMCLSVLVGFTGCNLADDIKANVVNRINAVDIVASQELARLVISAINDSSKTSDVYSLISDYQMNELSYSYFSEYMDILRSNSRQSNNGRVESFRMMSSSECVSILGTTLVNRYGDMIGVELIYQEEPTYPVYFFFSIDPNGVAFISNEWVRSLIDTYNYGNHYFTLLNEENHDGVRALITPSLTDPAYNDEAINAMVNSLCDYYRLRVMSNIGAYEIIHLYPGSMSVRIPETLAADGTSFEEHIVNFTYLNSGNYYIDEDIEMSPDPNLVYLVNGENRLLRIGNDYSRSSMISVMGEPIATTYYEDESVLIAMYPGVILRFENVEGSENSWNGTITSIRVYGNTTCSLGYHAYLGMSKTALLVAYPFIDETNYAVRLTTSTGTYNVEIQFDENDVISMIRITE